MQFKDECVETNLASFAFSMRDEQEKGNDLGAKHKGIVGFLISGIFAVLTLAAPVQAQEILPGTTAVAKVHFKPLGKNSALFEVIDFDCPPQLKTGKGRQKFEASLRREMSRELCRSLSAPLVSERVRFAYCRSSVVLGWTVSAKTCR